MSQQQSPPVDEKEIPDWATFQVSLTKHPIIRDEYGVLRYQENPLIVWLKEKVDLNEMGRLYRQGLWSEESFMQFYRDIGYSLSGFEEVWWEELDEIENGR